MKKLLVFLVLVAGLVAWGLAGCGDKAVDTGKLHDAFQSADAGARAEIDQGIAAVTISNFSAALPPWQHVAYATRLTVAQRLILEDSIKKVKARAKKAK